MGRAGGCRVRGGGGGGWGGYSATQKARMAVASRCPLGSSNSSGAPLLDETDEKYSVKNMEPWKRCWFFFKLKEQSKAMGIEWNDDYNKEWTADCPMDRIAEIAKRGFGVRGGWGGYGATQKARMAVASRSPLRSSNSSGAPLLDETDDKYSVKNMEPWKRCCLGHPFSDPQHVAWIRTDQSLRSWIMATLTKDILQEEKRILLLHQLALEPSTTLVAATDTGFGRKAVAWIAIARTRSWMWQS
ncbi:hypothetical protein ACH5RR_008027 [Cinchona calisaya]|uniref:Uncharacterized protein n=1 Tax=Cinchona calisaya TaxID=153742 RepID=A0ABD3AE29_9GENT